MRPVEGAADVALPSAVPAFLEACAKLAREAEGRGDHARAQELIDLAGRVAVAPRWRTRGGLLVVRPNGCKPLRTIDPLSPKPMRTLRCTESSSCAGRYGPSLAALVNGNAYDHAPAVDLDLCLSSHADSLQRKHNGRDVPAGACWSFRHACAATRAKTR